MSSDVIATRKTWLGIAGLIAGFLALLLYQNPLGAFPGVVGLALGIVQLWRGKGKGLAWGAIALSSVSLAAGAAYNLWYLPVVMAKVEQQYAERLNRWKGVLAPDLELVTLDGKATRLSELRGRRVVLVFWATWCPPCVAEIPNIIQLRRQIAEKNLYLAGLSEEDDVTLRFFVKKSGINYSIVHPNNAPEPFQESEMMIPTAFFIDRNGVIQDISLGYEDFDALEKLSTAPDTAGPPKPAPDTGLSVTNR